MAEKLTEEKTVKLTADMKRFCEARARYGCRKALKSN